MLDPTEYYAVCRLEDAVTEFSNSVPARDEEPSPEFWQSVRVLAAAAKIVVQWQDARR